MGPICGLDGEGGVGLGLSGIGIAVLGVGDGGR